MEPATAITSASVGLKSIQTVSRWSACKRNLFGCCSSRDEEDGGDYKNTTVNITMSCCGGGTNKEEHGVTYWRHDMPMYNSKNRYKAQSQLPAVLKDGSRFTNV